VRLEEIEFDVSLVTTEWFLCLFAKSLPSEVCCLTGPRYCFCSDMAYWHALGFLVFLCEVSHHLRSLCFMYLIVLL
jgi:hypothetical protein